MSRRKKSPPHRRNLAAPQEHPTPSAEVKRRKYLGGTLTVVGVLMLLVAVILPRVSLEAARALVGAPDYVLRLGGIALVVAGWLIGRKK